MVDACTIRYLSSPTVQRPVRLEDVSMTVLQPYMTNNHDTIGDTDRTPTYSGQFKHVDRLAACGHAELKQGRRQPHHTSPQQVDTHSLECVAEIWAVWEHAQPDAPSWQATLVSCSDNLAMTRLRGIYAGRKVSSFPSLSRPEKTHPGGRDAAPTRERGVLLNRGVPILAPDSGSLTGRSR
ncbi:hypothetical protein NM208_g16128 [Fusarium decemcellulare]|uniref:Uncharacterized protein n=1 Tax=Fusarium decemcellulare TaxID=57161 RepID=A0ACC1RDM6_9HYPO|nr:hypothetical protein NM208_g16128 [Fusarium decemcellulare]